MPVARTSGHAAKALLVAVIGVAVAMGLAWLISVLADRGAVELRLGEDRFRVGDAADIADRLARDRSPAFFPSLVGDRPIWVQHLGEDPESGWLAFDATDPHDPSCLIDWSVQDQVFVNRCDESVTYPPNGEGLRHYPTSVEDGVVYVDIAGLEGTAPPGGG